MITSSLTYQIIFPDYIWRFLKFNQIIFINSTITYCQYFGKQNLYFIGIKQTKIIQYCFKQDVFCRRNTFLFQNVLITNLFIQEKRLQVIQYCSYRYLLSQQPLSMQIEKEISKEKENTIAQRRAKNNYNNAEIPVIDAENQMRSNYSSPRKSTLIPPSVFLVHMYHYRYTYYFVLLYM